MASTKEPRRRRFGFEPAQALQLAGVAAAMVLATVVNVIGARHFKRWDWTTGHRYTLSSATLDTLHELDQRVDLWVIVGPADPVEQSLKQLLASYQAESSRLEVHYIDPDRDAVALVDLQQRFNLGAGRSQDGRVATDAVVIAASGDKHWFLTAQDMFEMADDVHVRPREERALTQAVRSVLGGQKAKLCFTVGHGELSIEPAREGSGIGQLANLLEKDNYELASVDATAPESHVPFDGCAVVVIAGPRAPFAKDETNRLRTYLLGGGSLLAAVGPIDGNTETGMAPAGLEDALGPFGIALEDDLVHETDAALVIPETHAEAFFVTARPHAVTAALVAAGAEAHPPRTAVFLARSLAHAAADGAVPAADVLVTSAGAFAKKSIKGAAEWPDVPPRASGDPGGPFVVAMASERAKVGPSAAHGPRVVAIGTRYALAEDNWRQPRPMHGAAFFVENALSWLTARPAVLDVPDKPQVAAGMRVSEEGRAQVRNYVLLLMPLAAGLLAIAVWAWRRSSEGEEYRRKPESDRRAGGGPEGEHAGESDRGTDGKDEDEGEA
jgi:hypothetical protein